MITVDDVGKAVRIIISRRDGPKVLPYHTEEKSRSHIGTLIRLILSVQKDRLIHTFGRNRSALSVKSGE